MNQKIAIITGANTGLGFETVKVLASLNYKIVIACRNVKKGQKAKQLIVDELPNSQIDVLHLDLSSQKCVHSFANFIKLDYKNIHLLINNAGIMMTPYTKTEDGFESQLATNFLGHFTLTGLLLPLIKNTDGARVVSLSSLAHKWSGIRFNDINFEAEYDKRAAYGQSKLACLMFAYELDRKFKNAGINAISVAAHPGISNTSLFQFTPAFLRWLTPLIGQKPEDGALPIIYAALAESLKGGEYIGPDGFNEWRGKPKVVSSNSQSKNVLDAAKLWSLAEEMTGVKYEF